MTAITNTFPLSSWQIGEGQVSVLTTGGTGRSRTRFLDHSAALRTGEGELALESDSHHKYFPSLVLADR